MNEPNDRMIKFIASRAYDHYQGRRWKHAEIATDLLIDMADDVADYWALHGIVKRELKKHDESLASLERARELAPDDGNVMINYAEALILTGDLRQGIEVLAEVFNEGYEAELSPEAQDEVTRRAGFNLAALKRMATARKQVMDAMDSEDVKANA